VNKTEDILWIWLLPDLPRVMDRDEWIRHGGKWIIFDRKGRIERIAANLSPLIDAGEIESAKYWKRDPSAICVYSLDRDREKVLEILKKLGAADSRVWEYDYAMGKNIQRPLDFLYSWSSKFRTIILSYGFIGTLRLVKDVLRSGRK
jgi:hypothetical protein